MTKYILTTYFIFCLVTTLSGGLPLQDKEDQKTNNHENKHHLLNFQYMREGANIGTPLKSNPDAVGKAGFSRLHKRNFDEIDRAGFNDFHKRSLDETDRDGAERFVKRSTSYVSNWTEDGELGKNRFHKADSLRLSKRNFDEINRSGFGKLISYIYRQT
ncbi:uncharacterized protein LOC143223009 [Tachypleus tridentatus]|uniref:uncharacterized protein LOC143223009 n=1 Tax=Tachypleus tridentatus TaxID=6853 RepID=UPI003FD643E4